ncbi:Soluble aldose sugar dehydrogenase YliI [Saliniradius amylolyticus]|uniref:Soluble aldose sugar dehydrogenase YliI n=1 Tax=Saliniradius amylolyticus TaxID=2183582 RepID=A0A2S2E500_9ALTE|nr:PQQ-dependent sugar dehydrogenase [Saliniradius amylolyticus]AWL12725.1 Soluble aldose sugar dehydrogenase YliI [Saliniradius amylolyticus]
MKTTTGWLLAVSAALSFTSLADNETRQLYLENCASCHGDNYGGGMAPSMLDDEWVNGGSVKAIASSIRHGIESRGMPAWEAKLSESQIQNLAKLLHSAGQQQSDPQVTKPEAGFHSDYHSFDLQQVLSTDGVIWAFDFLPGGSLIFTERNGDLMLFEQDRMNRIAGTPEVWHFKQGGLLDVKVDPEYTDNGWIYLSYSQKTGKNDNGTDVGSLVVIRGRIQDGQWVDQQRLWAPPEAKHINRGWHFGSRFAIDGDYLFFSNGDEGYRDRAQDIDIQNGKIHRIYKDGRVPEDNPFVGNPDGMDSIWSYGHRNPQGMTFTPDGQTLWATEHGPKGGDELNRIQKGGNYGWPKATFGINYDGTPITEHTSLPGMVDPVHHWTPSIAAAGINFYTGSAFPRWQGDLFVSSLAMQELHRIRLKDNEVLEDEVVLKDEGRIRDVATAPDGTLFIAINDNENGVHRIMRLHPAGD